MKLNILKPVDPAKNSAKVAGKETSNKAKKEIAPNWDWRPDSDEAGDFYWKSNGWRLYADGRIYYNCYHFRSGTELHRIRGLENAKRICQFVHPTIPKSYK